MKPRQEAAPYMLTAAVSSFRLKRGLSRTGRQWARHCALPLKRTRAITLLPRVSHDSHHS
eukprot:2303795-Prymnesium_polylepis.1